MCSMFVLNYYNFYTINYLSDFLAQYHGKPVEGTHGFQLCKIKGNHD
jgi:hypothetical protein